MSTSLSFHIEGFAFAFAFAFNEVASELLSSFVLRQIAPELPSLYLGESYPLPWRMLTFGCFVVWSMAFPFLTLARMLTLNVPWRMTCLSSFLSHLIDIRNKVVYQMDYM